MNKISLAIMAVPQRLHQVKINLLERLPQASLHVDWKCSNLWKNAKAAWLSYSSTATHHIVIQDDARVCNDFMQHAAQIIELFPEQAVSFYSGYELRHAQSGAIRKNCHFFYLRFGVTGVALLLPTAWIKPWIAWSDQHIQENMHDDPKLKLWLALNSKFMLYTVPELVQHLGGMSSILGYNSKTKTSLTYSDAFDPPMWNQNLANIPIYQGNKENMLRYKQKYYQGPPINV